MNAVAFEAAVAEDLPGLHAGENVLDTGSDLFVGPVVVFFRSWELGLAAVAAVRDAKFGARVAAVGDREGLADGSLGTGSSHALQSLRFPASGRPTTTTRRMSASMTTWWLVEYR
ncbi:hypothetical protein RKD18_000306 [Streptomyces phaeoluteigriseus]